MLPGSGKHDFQKILKKNGEAVRGYEVDSDGSENNKNWRKIFFGLKEEAGGGGGGSGGGGGEDPSTTSDRIELWGDEFDIRKDGSIWGKTICNAFTIYAFKTRRYEQQQMSFGCREKHKNNAQVKTIN
jgi:hypothetical protein